MENLVFKAELLRSDHDKENMTFKVENGTNLKAGNYIILPAEDYKELKRKSKEYDVNRLQ